MRDPCGGVVLKCINRRILDTAAILAVPLSYIAIIFIAYGFAPMVVEEPFDASINKPILLSSALAFYFCIAALRWWFGKGVILLAIGLSFMSIGAVLAYTLILVGGDLTLRDVLIGLFIAVFQTIPLIVCWAIFLRRVWQPTSQVTRKLS
jgi:hypothetical protein